MYISAQWVTKDMTLASIRLIDRSICISPFYLKLCFGIVIFRGGLQKKEVEIRGSRGHDFCGRLYILFIGLKILLWIANGRYSVMIRAPAATNVWTSAFV